MNFNSTTFLVMLEVERPGYQDRLRYKADQHAEGVAKRMRQLAGVGSGRGWDQTDIYRWRDHYIAVELGHERKLRGSL